MTFWKALAEMKPLERNHNGFWGGTGGKVQMKFQPLWPLCSLLPLPQAGTRCPFAPSSSAAPLEPCKVLTEGQSPPPMAPPVLPVRGHTQPPRQSQHQHIQVSHGATALSRGMLQRRGCKFYYPSLKVSSVQIESGPGTCLCSCTWR